MRGTLPAVVIIVSAEWLCAQNEICVNVFGFIIRYYCMLMSTEKAQRMNMVRRMNISVDSVTKHVTF